jgi:hypothetical protein
VETLRRWEDFGGVWTVAYRSGSKVSLSLCRCDAGEEVERLSYDDPALVEWLDAQTEAPPRAADRAGGSELLDGGVPQQQPLDPLRPEVDRRDGLVADSVEGDDAAHPERVVDDPIPRSE